MLEPVTAKTGSPPRAWGKWRCGRWFPRDRRFTPTCVGKIHVFLPPDFFETVHPHVRGENSLSTCSSAFPIGSPPRAWGKSTGLHIVLFPLRFTPTCVGKILFFRSPSPWRSGSPPRAWGKLCRTLQHPHLTTVHPHVRGENLYVLDMPGYDLRFTPTCVGKMSLSSFMTNAPDGSPPRAWGKCNHSTPSRVRGRFTPTCVGKMRAETLLHQSTAVHPHVRGENYRI